MIIIIIIIIITIITTISSIIIIIVIIIMIPADLQPQVPIASNRAYVYMIVHNIVCHSMFIVQQVIVCHIVVGRKSYLCLDVLVISIYVFNILCHIYLFNILCHIYTYIHACIY